RGDPSARAMQGTSNVAAVRSALSNRTQKTPTTEGQRAAYFLMSGRRYPKRGIGASRHRGLPAAKTAGIVVMMRSLSRFPDGAAGIALVLLRLACAWIAFLVVARLAFPQFSANAS